MMYYCMNIYSSQMYSQILELIKSENFDNLPLPLADTSTERLSTSKL